MRRPAPPTASVCGLALGYAADRLLGDPPRWHPVAGFGRLASRAERRLYCDAIGPGVVFTTVLVGGAGVIGSLVEQALRERPWVRFLATAAVTWAVLGGRSLVRESEAVSRHLHAGDLAGAREQVGHLVSRDPRTLDAPGVCRAALESVAENTCDAVVAPLLAGAMAGVPGLLVYRAANTLDAMVGYRSDRYEHFGKASARLDDVLNFVPARVTAGLTLVVASLVGGDVRSGWRAVRDQAPDHPSPNAGRVEAAFAGVLGVRLGGLNVYGGVAEERATLGTGDAPTTTDLARANLLATLVSHAALALAMGTASLRSARRGRG